MLDVGTAPSACERYEFREVGVGMVVFALGNIERICCN